MVKVTEIITEQDSYCVAIDSGGRGERGKGLLALFPSSIPHKVARQAVVSLFLFGEAFAFALGTSVRFQ